MKIWKSAAVGAMAVCFTDFAVAQDIPVPDPDSFDRLLGVAGVAVPDYEGSDDYTGVAAPLAQFRFHENRYIQLVGNKVFLNVLNHENWEFGPLGIYRLGREDVEDSVVDTMLDLDDSLEVGAFLGFAKKFNNDIRHRMNIHFDVTQDVSDGHEGYVAQLAGIYWRPVAKRFDIGFRANVTYASEDYMSSYFDVTAADAAASGLSTFDADSGFKDAGIALMGVFHLTQNWHVGGTVLFKRLLGDAEDSPVVDVRGDPNQLFAGLSILYTW